VTRSAIPTWCYALVVARRGDEYLLIQERKHGGAWYLPAGRVEAGESFGEAALRETEEEAGIAVVLDGIVRVEHTPRRTDARLRVVFSATSDDPREPKKFADRHSLQARWVPFQEISDLLLRGDEMLDYLDHVHSGRPMAPVEILARELGR
jgi:phosphatase NudJ